jgi:putative tricarboxylic transport membrane protein
MLGTLTLPRGENAVAAVLAALAAYVLWEACQMPGGAPGQPGPGFFPVILATVLLVCSAGLMLRNWRAPEGTSSATVLSFRYPKAWITLAALVAMTFALEPLGFVLAGTLFLIVLLRFCGGVAWATASAGAIVIAVAAWYFFVTVLGVNLPHGVLRF